MSDHEGAGTSADGGTKQNPYVEAGDTVLRPDGDDVRARHVVVTVDEECGEMLAVGEADERMQRVGTGGRVAEGRLRQAQRSPGLNEANFIDRDFVDGGFCRVHGDLPCGEPLSSARSSRRGPRGAPWYGGAHSPRVSRVRDTGKAELCHPKGRR